MHHFHIRMLLLLAAACLLIAGCDLGGTPSPTAVVVPPTPTPTPREISAQIGKATQITQSVHFEIALSGKPVAVDESGFFTITSITGDLKRPDGVLATLKVGGVAGTNEIKSVSLAGKQYFTNPITLAWQCLEPGAVFDPAVLFDPARGVEYLLQQNFENVTLVGTEEIAGQPNYHLRGTIAAAPLQAISGGKLGAGPAAVDIWAATDTLLASRLVLVDTATDPDKPSTWTITFSDYDKPVDVRPPPEVNC